MAGVMLGKGIRARDHFFCRAQNDLIPLLKID